MLRKALIRLGLGVLLIASVTALAAASGGSASLNFVTGTSVPSHDAGQLVCNSAAAFAANERHYCLVATTYSNLKKTGGVEVDLNLQNYDQSSLTNPTARLTWANTGVNLSLVSSDPSICSSSTAGQVDCTFPNLPGVGSASGPDVTPVSYPVKLFFTVASSVSSINFEGTANAKESGHDNGGAANVETQTVDTTMTFGQDDARDATFALPGGSLELDALVPSSASVKFRGGSGPFLAQFQASSNGTCFPGIACTGFQLETDLHAAPSGTFSAGSPITWTADINATNTNVVAVHYYDPVSITGSPIAKTFTTTGKGFASCDGVNFGSNAPGGLGSGDYFVINASTSATSTTFQVAATASGKPLSFTGSGAFSGSCIRIIGDQKSEKTGPCTLTAPPATPAQLPALCAVKLTNTMVRVYLLDTANGHVTY
jgi:hypothetical protein